jgi:two-component system, LuxR family, response regulator FixJ
MKTEPTLFLVDDDPAVLRLLGKVTRSLGVKTDAYTSAEEFLEAYEPSGPGCLVLDLRMPSMSGQEVQQQLAGSRDILPVIFITAHADVRLAVEAMEQGAFSLLEKPFRSQELCDKIQEAVRLAQDNWRHRQQREHATGRLAQLTPAERRVLGFVVEGATSKTIAGTLGISVRTVDVHRARITKKLGAKSQIELARLVETAGSS